MGWGNAGYLAGRRTNGWRWEQVKGSDYARYHRLFEDGNFLQRYIVWNVSRLLAGCFCS
jgi:hypothetical protein